MTDYVYVDNSNLWIEGKRLSASLQEPVTRLHKRGIGVMLDEGFKINFRSLYSFLANPDRAPARAVLFGSQNKALDPTWSSARAAGFETKITQRLPGRGEKGVDVALVSTMLVDVLGARGVASVTVTLVAGDADFVPALEKLKETGCRTEVAFWTHATAESLHAVCDKFIALDSYINHLRWAPPARHAMITAWGAEKAPATTVLREFKRS